MLNEFKAFLLKENVFALALAVVIGAALGKVVTGVVDDFVMPIVADQDATDEVLKGKHVVLIGRPVTNSVTKRFVKAFPVTFGQDSATVNEKVYAHERTAIVAAGVNPVDAKYSVVAIAGFSADATYCAAESIIDAPSAEVLIFPRGTAAVTIVIQHGLQQLSGTR